MNATRWVAGLQLKWRTLRACMAANVVEQARSAEAGAEPVAEQVKGLAKSQGKSGGEQDDEVVLYTDSRPAILWGTLALVVGFFGFLAWASTAPLDEGVPAPGVVTVEGKRKTLQHPRGGVIEQINVRDGDVVRAGQVLVSLNNTDARSQRESAQTQYWSAVALEARLIAEQTQAPSIFFPADLALNTDIRAQAAVRNQQNLFSSRRSAMLNQLRILEENLRGLQEQINGLQALQAGKKTQIRLLTDELESMSDLVLYGYVPKVRLMELQRTLADISGSRGEDIANIARTRSSIAEIKLRMVQTRQDYQKEAQQQLPETQKELETLGNRLTILNEDVDRAELRASVDGIVVGLGVFTIGGVIQPGQTVLEIVPERGAMIVEVQIPTHLIEKVRVGLSAEIRFSTVQGSQLPAIEGELINVSADRFIDQASGQPYYLGAVKFTEEAKLRMATSNHGISPGMSVDVIIKTGERTLLEYLTTPLLKRISGALREI
jgi:HlyD family type I secretion membrane fusion protein